MSEPTQATLAVWLQDVVATVLDADTLAAFDAAITFAATCSGPQVLDIVALGHRVGGKDQTDWFANLARSKGAPIPTVGNEALVTRLAAASIIRLATSGSKPAIVAALASQSAAFLGLTADLPEVTRYSDDVVLKTADAVRTRTFSYQPTAPKVPRWVDQALAAPTEGTAPSERPDWEAPAVAVAKELDALMVEIQKRFELLEEEYNLLWWSHAGRSLTADAAWGDVAPPERRVVLVGCELGERTRIPATAMADGLAAVALGDVAAKELALANVVVAARNAGVSLAAVEHTLLPISTAVAQACLYNEDDTWKTVVKKVHGIDVGKTQVAAEIARQLVREQHLGKLL